MKSKMTKEKLALEIIDRLKKEYPDAGCTLDYEDAWKLLVSVRLAAQCTDARVNVVVQGLYEKYPTVHDLAQADVASAAEVENMLAAVFALLFSINFSVYFPFRKISMALSLILVGENLTIIRAVLLYERMVFRMLHLGFCGENTVPSLSVRKHSALTNISSSRWILRTIPDAVIRLRLQLQPLIHAGTLTKILMIISRRLWMLRLPFSPAKLRK